MGDVQTPEQVICFWRGALLNVFLHYWVQRYAFKSYGACWVKLIQKGVNRMDDTGVTLPRNPIQPAETGSPKPYLTFT